jgi:hypothetical protein
MTRINVGSVGICYEFLLSWLFSASASPVEAALAERTRYEWSCRPLKLDACGSETAWAFPGNVLCDLLSLTMP